MIVIKILDKIECLIRKLKYFLLEKRARYLIQRNAAISYNSQDLNIYWDPDFFESSKRWGLGTVWTEIQFLLAGCKGRVLDIACGPGKVISILSKFDRVSMYGCDISDFLINEAVKSGIPRSKLKVCDATKLPYSDKYFEYSYSIGSLEHFTENGIIACLQESFRATRYASFHQVPISRTGINEGWIKLGQSYNNNSVDWWLEKFRGVYEKVYVMDSSWRSSISNGKWFICIK